MAKLYKATVYVLDVNECYSDLDEIFCEAERGAEDANFICFEHKGIEIEWDDDININKWNASKEDYDLYFENT